MVKMKTNPYSDLCSKPVDNGEPVIETTAETKRANRELCEKYPFLIPHNTLSNKYVTEATDGGYWLSEPDTIPEYDWEYTKLDEMPEGWRKAFGEQMCAEIMEALEADGLLDRYRVDQIKEKWAVLRWYDHDGSDKVDEIRGKYEELSERTCMKCGAPATKYSVGWYAPWCDKCAEEIGGRFLTANEYFGEESG